MKPNYKNDGLTAEFEEAAVAIEQKETKKQEGKVDESSRAQTIYVKCLKVDSMREGDACCSTKQEKMASPSQHDKAGWRNKKQSVGLGCNSEESSLTLPDVD